MPLIAVNNLVISEGDAGEQMVTVTVSLSSSSALTTTVNFATKDDSAIADQDYVAATGNLIFIPGSTQRTFNVKLIGDTQPEATETFRVELSSPANARIADNFGLVTIKDDDEGSPESSQHIFLPVIQN